jgi:hypothetical protein
MVIIDHIVDGLTHTHILITLVALGVSVLEFIEVIALGVK